MNMSSNTLLKLCQTIIMERLVHNVLLSLLHTLFNHTCNRLNLRKILSRCNIVCDTKKHFYNKNDNKIILDILHHPGDHAVFECGQHVTGPPDRRHCGRHTASHTHDGKTPRRT